MISFVRRVFLFSSVPYQFASLSSLPPFVPNDSNSVQKNIRGTSSTSSNSNIMTMTSTSAEGMTIMTMTPELLIGKTFTYEYGSTKDENLDTYKFTILSKDSIKWIRTASTKYDVGQSDTETYVATAVPPNNVMISWVEADGLSLTNLMNFNTMKVLTHGSQGRYVFQHTAKLTLLEEK